MNVKQFNVILVRIVVMEVILIGVLFQRLILVINAWYKQKDFAFK